MRKRKILPPLFCEICGASVPRNPGHPAKTCGAICHKERIRRQGAAYYLKVKDTQEWKAVKQDYLEKLKKAMAEDPEFAAVRRAYQAFIVRQWKSRVDENLEKRELLLAKKRAWSAHKRREMEKDPAAFEKHKADARAWYASLSEEERDRIFYAPRRLPRP